MGSVSDYIVYYFYVFVVVCCYKNYYYGYGYYYWMMLFWDKLLFFMNRLYINIWLCYFYCMMWIFCVFEFFVNVFCSGFFLLIMIVFEYVVYIIFDEVINVI